MAAGTSTCSTPASSDPNKAELHQSCVRAPFQCRLTVEHGGHDIPEERIRARWTSSRQNLIRLLPHLAHLEVFDNSADVAPGEALPDPKIVLEMKVGIVLYPALDDSDACGAVPDWAKPVVAAAFRLHREKGASASATPREVAPVEPTKPA
jgi:hypothetical protein